eukprot:scaffold50_cov420-Prasinococcus_capsulatus_cf.AAC.16
MGEVHIEVLVAVFPVPVLQAATLSTRLQGSFVAHSEPDLNGGQMAGAVRTLALCGPRPSMPLGSALLPARAELVEVLRQKAPHSSTRPRRASAAQKHPRHRLQRVVCPGDCERGPRVCTPLPIAQWVAQIEVRLGGQRPALLVQHAQGRPREQTHSVPRPLRIVPVHRACKCRRQVSAKARASGSNRMYNEPPILPRVLRCSHTRQDAGDLLQQVSGEVIAAPLEGRQSHWSTVQALALQGPNLARPHTADAQLNSGMKSI